MERQFSLSCFGALTLACLACAASNASTSESRATQPRIDPTLPRQADPKGLGTRLLAQPSVHGDQLAFVYLGDLWTSRTDGSGLLRLTTIPGDEGRPQFSPDGASIAFSANYDGNYDVYLVPTAGGEPKRLTWHPGADIVRGFTPDGERVLFVSQRRAHSRSIQKLHTISIHGGGAQELPLPTVSQASFSPDGKRIAYTPLSSADGTWKNYRGGTTSRIWICNLEDLAVEELPQPEGRCNDTQPMWVGETLYFRSDRDGEYNLFSYRAGEVARLTDHGDFPILDAGSDGSTIVYEQAGWLHSFDPLTQRSRQLAIHVPAEALATRPRFAKGAEFIRSAHISPKGKRAVFEFRGEILTLPAEKGNQRNLTNSPGAHERSPAWSPDGQWVAYFSDAGGEYALELRSSDGKGEPRTLELEGAGFYSQANWSPNSKLISYMDNAATLYIIDVESGKCSKVSSEPYYGPDNQIANDWSPDSCWLAYTQGTTALQATIQLYEVKSAQSHALTDGLSLADSPAFDASGKYLYFTASTDAGPASTWFAMSNADMQTTNQIYLAVLSSENESPLAPTSDEEEMLAMDKDQDDAPADGAEASEPSKADQELKPSGPAEAEPTRVDFEGIEQRILHLGAKANRFGNLVGGSEGQLFFLAYDAEASSSLAMYSLNDQKQTALAPGVVGFALSADRSKLLLAQNGGFQIATAGMPVSPGEGLLASSELEVKIDPRQEWQQIYHEAWRINRDFFYDPEMHGADWSALRDKYAALLPAVRSRADLNRVIQWLLSELSVGHHGVRGGDMPSSSPKVAGGLLGADYEVHENRYRISKIFGGLNWNPGLPAPLAQPGVKVAAGDYLLAVNGTPLLAQDNLFERFENTAGKLVALSVGTKADGSDARLVQVTPIESESALRNRDWVEGNYKRVTEATAGRVAYVFVPDTAGEGHQYFKRYFYPQSDRAALIVDDRFNSGGQVADYVIDILRRPYVAHWAMRYGKDYVTPHGAIQGPKIMLINESAGSGGDLLPWMFAEFELGTLVGRRTWGGLVGILGFPVLLDGGSVQAPNIAFWTEKEGFGVENVGVPPHVEVNMYPADCRAGRDPQLERAIELALEALDAAPAVEAPRPAFPTRVRR